MLRLNLQPIDPVTVNLIYYKFMFNDAATAGVTCENYADEYNLIVDWAVNDHLSLSVVGAIADPDDGATQQTQRGDDTWSHVMFFGTVKF